MWSSNIIRRKVYSDIIFVMTGSVVQRGYGFRKDPGEVTDRAMQLLSDRTQWEKFKNHQHQAYMKNRDKRLNFLTHCKIIALKESLTVIA